MNIRFHLLKLGFEVVILVPFWFPFVAKIFHIVSLVAGPFVWECRPVHMKCMKYTGSQY